MFAHFKKNRGPKRIGFSCYYTPVFQNALPYGCLRRLSDPAHSWHTLMNIFIYHMTAETLRKEEILWKT